ncbi:putative membrane protein [Asticcacaulis biprosthecium C19]|uniref:Putative membrane protein n=1 Tax=Asticcacaulis biprosthecium C19 TaxID=715226 RepID=F4QRD3_9CAUL|nr:hypothetical protein [Asticcacaulis biprosthecium]EGF90770.1 putative membrane protein [Asticcacaulis biprosthecium C19]
MSAAICLRPVIAAIALWSVSAPVWASNAVRPGADGVKFTAVFNDTGPVAKLVFVVLVVSAILALVLSFLKRKRGEAFVSGLRTGGILVSLAAAAFLAMNICVRMVYDGGVPPFVIWAPGLAEILMVVMAGFVASGAAAFAHATMARPAKAGVQ